MFLGFKKFLVMFIMVEGIRLQYFPYWKLPCPCRNISIAERIHLSPYVALAKIIELHHGPDQKTYNCTANVQLMIKGGEIENPLNIVNIKREIDGIECHTLHPDRRFILFFRATGNENEYNLENVDQVEYNADEKLINEICKTGGVCLKEIDFSNDPGVEYENLRVTKKGSIAESLELWLRRMFYRASNPAIEPWKSSDICITTGYCLIALVIKELIIQHI